MLIVYMIINFPSLFFTLNKPYFSQNGHSGLASFGIGGACGTVGAFGKEIMRGHAHGFASSLISTSFGGDF